MSKTTQITILSEVAVVLWHPELAMLFADTNAFTNTVVLKYKSIYSPKYIKIAETPRNMRGEAMNTRNHLNSLVTRGGFSTRTTKQVSDPLSQLPINHKSSRRNVHRHKQPASSIPGRLMHVPFQRQCLSTPREKCRDHWSPLINAIFCPSSKKGINRCHKRKSYEASKCHGDRAYRPRSILNPAINR